MTSPVDGLFTFTEQEFNRKHWPHQHVIKSSSRRDVERWCWNNFKGRFWRSKGNRYAFKREKDYMMFLLKWS